MNNLLPVLSTERLILKAVTLEDAPSYKKHFVDYDVVQYLSSAVPWQYPEDGVEYFLNHLILPRQGKDRWCYGIFLKSNPKELIGCVDLWREPIPENRGFWLGKKYWGQGIMTEAVKPITDYAFDVLGFEKLYFSNAVENTASRRVKEKSGATFIGVRSAEFVNPSFVQAELWELTKENWKKFSRPFFVGSILSTDRLLLNSFTEPDAPEVARLAGDKRVVEMTASLPYPYEIPMAVTWINSHKEQLEKDSNYIFAMRFKESSALIGCINIILNDKHDRGYLGYWIGHEFWNKGYGTEALKEVIKFGFEKLQVNKIWAEHKTINIGSGRVMEKAGMKHEGIMRNHFKQSDYEYLDMSVKSILRSEYKKNS